MRREADCNYNDDACEEKMDLRPHLAQFFCLPLEKGDERPVQGYVHAENSYTKTG